MKVVALFVRYCDKKYPSALEYFKKYLSIIKNHDVKIIVIENKKQIDSYMADNITYIKGDNTVHEFSGWDKGLEYIKNKNIEYDIVIFANDAFLAPSGYYSPRMIMCDESIGLCYKNGFFGSIMNCGNFKINNKKVEKYIRTNCFMLSKKIINSIDGVTSFDLDFINKCIDKEISFPYFKDNAPLNSFVKENIINNLTKFWHSAFKLEDNWELFRMKSLMLLNELFLYTKISKYVKKQKKKNINLKNKKIVCIGAATVARNRLASGDFNDSNIVCFLDNYVSGEINGIPIYTPEEFILKNIKYDFAIYTMFQPETIRHQIENLGIKTKE